MHPISYPIAGERSKFTTRLGLVGAVALLVLCGAEAQSLTIVQDDNDVDLATFKGCYVSAFSVERPGQSDNPCGSSEARIGDRLRIGVMGLAGWLEKLVSEGVLVSPTAKHGEELIEEQVPNIRLFIGGHLLTTLPPAYSFKDDAKSYNESESWGREEARQADHGRIWLDFSLRRDSSDKKSREDWSWLLKVPGIAPKLPLAVGVYNSTSNSGHVLPSYIDKGANPREFRLIKIDWNAWTIADVIILGAAVVVFFLLAGRSGIIRDPYQPVREDGLPPYSLGRCQMAWWFFLVAGAFCFLWIVTGRGDVDTINGTALSLIGISAGTALGAFLISNNQADQAAIARSPGRNFREEIAAARQALGAAKGAWNVLRKNPAADSAALGRARGEVQNKTGALATLKREFKDWKRGHRNQFLMDILSEDVGIRQIITFQRFQIVVWTIVLGVIFVSNVVYGLAMPTFDSSILVLMGISSGTYLGFKLPSSSTP